MNRMKGFLSLLLLLALVPCLGLATTYVFPYEGFRYTRQENEIVLTQTNLEEHADFIASLGTNVEAVLTNYTANSIVMEVIPEDGGQIAISVSENPYFSGEKTAESMDVSDWEELLLQFADSGLYEETSLTDTEPVCVRVTSSAMYASMPVYSIRYITLNLDKLYTLTLTVIGRTLEAEDDLHLASVLSGMKLFEARHKAPEATPIPESTPAPEKVPSYARLQNVKGKLSLEPVEATVYEESLLLSGETDASASLKVSCGGTEIGQATAGEDGAFTIRVRLPELGENHLLIESETASGELTLTYALPPATVTVLDPTETVFTGESVLIRGQTVPDATVYLNGEMVNTNVRANRTGAFSCRISVTKAGTTDIVIRSHASGYSDSSTTLTLTRVLTEREEVAEFRNAVVTIDYATLKANPQAYADAKFIFRGKVMEYTDYNGHPCALVCTSNPSTGVWKDPLFIVIEKGEAPAVGEVMTFYLIGEGITLPAASQYTTSGSEEEVPVTSTFYITSSR